MEPKLDIVPIHVIANSANQAEMLNGLLRAQGVAVKPLWLEDVANWQGPSAELVFYFADTESHRLEEALAHAEREGAALIAIAREHDPQAAVQALDNGAADCIALDDPERIAAVTRRERRRIRAFERLRQLEHDNERLRSLLVKPLDGSRNAMATLVDGIVVEANAACSQCFGLEETEALLGSPLMDWFTEASQPRLKRALRSALKKGASPSTIERLSLRSPDGGEREVGLTLEPAEGGAERRILVHIHDEGAGDEAAGENPRALEEENERAKDEARAPPQTEAGSNILLPGVFAPVAAEQIELPRPEVIRALAIIRPCSPQEAFQTFGALGAAEAGAHMAAAMSPLLATQDIATRFGDWNILALVERPDEVGVEQWAESVLETLAQRIFEGGGHSTHLQFVAGYTPVDRVRQLDALTLQAQRAADNARPGTVSRGSDGTATVAIDDKSWGGLIREALESQRYTVALAPIENLASGSRFWAALPRLLDRDGHEIIAELFQPPAKRLGLLPILENRLVGHALRALLGKKGDNTRMIVPLHADTVAEAPFFDFLDDLMAHTHDPPQPGSLVLELDVDQIADRIRELERFAEQALEHRCALGLRGYVPESSNRFTGSLAVKTVRMSPGITERLADERNEALVATLESEAAQWREKGVMLIATNVSDPNMMAALYNLGVGTVEGPAIGPPELFQPAASES